MNIDSSSVSAIGVEALEAALPDAATAAGTFDGVAADANLPNWGVYELVLFRNYYEY